MTTVTHFGKDKMQYKPYKRGLADCAVAIPA
jgi:hypothetical protein